MDTTNETKAGEGVSAESGSTLNPSTPEITGVPAEPVSSETASTDTAVAPEVHASRKTLWIAVGIIVVGALIAGGYFMMKTQGEAVEDGPVAIVNGFKIARDEFNNSVSMIQQTASLQGADVSDPAVQTAINDQALDILVNNALLIEGAKAGGYQATDEEIQAEYDKLVTDIGGVETLTARMAEVGLTEEKLRSNIGERIMVDKYIEAETDIEDVSVTDEEVAGFIDSLSASGQELPPIETLSPQVREELLAQKRQAIVTEFLTGLRDAAQIDIKI